MLDQHSRKIIVAAVIALEALGCSAAKETTDDTSRSQLPPREGQKAPLAYFESTFRPSEYDEDVEVMEKKLSGQAELPETDSRSDSVSVEEETVQGFRIQIFASASIDEANLAKQLAAQSIVTDSLYIVYDPPVYKVRVGDYPTRLDANRALASVIHHGYPDAWVVTDRITQRTIVRVPRVEQ